MSVIFCGNFLKNFIFLLCVIGNTCKSVDSVFEETTITPITDVNSTVTEADSFANYDTLLESTSNSSQEITTTVRAPEEPKLPEDLISQDVLLDPNIVLARLSRDLRGMNLQPYYGHSSNYNYSPHRRISNNYKNINKKYKGDNIKRRYDAPRIKIYPVFPGK